jgi:hypothetical protein
LVFILAYHQIDLGYCKVAVFKAQRFNDTNGLEITQGKQMKLLHSGAPQGRIQDTSDEPRNSYTGTPTIPNQQQRNEFNLFIFSLSSCY